MVRYLADSQCSLILAYTFITECTLDNGSSSDILVVNFIITSQLVIWTLDAERAMDAEIPKT